ncbi:MAG: J domain-containing protein [Gammaproteobacteria bacterium]|nr:J domain-containing protein [Gammaproteobacteria bacterium]
MAAYAVLGLEKGASKEEIRQAYRRLAQVHHPDRFSSLGEESVAAGTSTFQRINEAYAYLVRYA